MLEKACRYSSISKFNSSIQISSKKKKMFSCTERPQTRIIRRSSSNRSHTESIQSGNFESIANNYDLLIQILVCLPVKSLVRFKSVSKAWQSLISDPNFSRRLFPYISGLIIQKVPNQYIDPKVYEYGFIPLSHTSTAAPFKFVNFTYHPLGLNILQSCNGLLLCAGSFPKPRTDFRQDYYVYNPSTKQFVMLPPPANQNTLRVYGVSLAFDTTKSPHYKVVCVHDPGLEVQDDPAGQFRVQIEIYSSETKSWRLSGNPFTTKFYMGFNNVVFCNGAIHWLTQRGTTSPYFNVEEEKLREMSMPPFPNDWEGFRRYKYFGESQGHLQLIEYKPPTTQFDVYEIKSDYSGWFVKYHIDLDPLTAAFPEMIVTYPDDFSPSDSNYYYAFSVLCIVREANEEESYMVLQIPEKAFQYNLKDGSFKKICDLDRNYFYGQGRAEPFIQTLSSI